MALTYVKYYSGIAALLEADIDVSTDTFKIALSNTAPDLTDVGLADASEISAGNGYSAGGETVTISSTGQTTGTYTVSVGSNVTFTATTGAIATFRYVILYSDTSTGDLLLGYWDYGSGVDITAGNSFQCNLSGTDILTAS